MVWDHRPSPSLRAELQILSDVTTYRLRRLEMANLGGTFALALALHLPWPEVALRLGFGLLLNILVYLNNDYLDGDDDLAADSRDHGKTDFLMRHRGAALRAQLGLVAALALLAAWHDDGLGLVLLLGGGVCFAYSLVLKRRPVVDVLAMMAWGVAMPLAGVPTDRIAEAAPLLVMLGLFSGVFESIQVVRDLDEDRARGVRTTAVVFGRGATLLLMRVLACAAAVHAWSSFGLAVAIPIAWGVVRPVADTDPNALWNRMRGLCGLAFVIACWRLWSGG